VKTNENEEELRFHQKLLKINQVNAQAVNSPISLYEYVWIGEIASITCLFSFERRVVTIKSIDIERSIAMDMAIDVST
jgi:AAA15 family ATPase/GTPase